jgi:NAD(P)-dependent dehydrogenase (short-subunit alcohol dehydrogenase family)
MTREDHGTPDGGGRPLAVVTGASTGIGYELAKCCAEHGFDLVVAADEPEIDGAAEDFRALGAEVDAVEADLATREGVENLYRALAGRPVDALLANAGAPRERGPRPRQGIPRSGLRGRPCRHRYERDRDRRSPPARRT